MGCWLPFFFFVSPYFPPPTRPQKSLLPSCHLMPFWISSRTFWRRQGEIGVQANSVFLSLPASTHAHRSTVACTVIRSPPGPARRNAPTAGQTQPNTQSCLCRISHKQWTGQGSTPEEHPLPHDQGASKFPVPKLELTPRNCSGSTIILRSESKTSCRHLSSPAATPPKPI